MPSGSPEFILTASVGVATLDGAMGWAPLPLL